MGGIITRWKEQIWEPDEKKIISEQGFKDLADKTSFQVSELKHWFGLFIKNYPEGYMKRETFHNEFADYFPHGDARAISHYLFNLFDAADDLKKVENDENEQTNDDEEDDKDQVSFTEYMEALAWANQGCTEKTLMKRIEAWQYDLDDGFGPDKYKKYIKNGKFDESMKEGVDFVHFINPHSKNEKELVEKHRGEKLRLFVENIRLTEKLKFAFHLYDHEDQQHGERDRKIDFGELENVINGIFKLFGSNLRELHNQHEQNEKEFTDNLTHNRAVEIFKIIYGDDWEPEGNENDGITIVDFIKLSINCRSCGVKINDHDEAETLKSRLSQIDSNLSDLSLDATQRRESHSILQKELQKTEDKLIKELVIKTLECCRCNNGVDTSDEANLEGEDLCLPWCVSQQDPSGECPLGFKKPDESENSADQQLCQGKCGAEAKEDDDKQIRTVRDALMMYHELDLTLKINGK